MKIITLILSLITILIGLAPIIKIKIIPTSGTTYAIYILVIGVIFLLYGTINILIDTLQRNILRVIGIIITFLGLFALFPKITPTIIPTSGLIFSLTIIILGLIAGIISLLTS